MSSDEDSGVSVGPPRPKPGVVQDDSDDDDNKSTPNASDRKRKETDSHNSDDDDGDARKIRYVPAAKRKAALEEEQREKGTSLRILKTIGCVVVAVIDEATNVFIEETLRRQQQQQRAQSVAKPAPVPTGKADKNYVGVSSKLRFKNDKKQK